MSYCAIDFGTSNSAVALPRADGAGMLLAPVEGQQQTLPTAIFFNHDEGVREYGRTALASYIDGFDGRLMRSMKSILGSSLAGSTTDLGDGTAMPYVEIITLFIDHLKQRAQACAGQPLDRAVLGRPIFFVDDDPRADRLSQSQLEAAARRAGFDEIQFQYEPIAAAFDYESRQSAEKLVLVADIGGGTSDFSLVRVGPDRMKRLDRKDDVLAHHGVHVAGTDYDRRVELATILPAFGYRARDPEGRELPSGIYFDLATWHLINTVYTPKRLAELKLARHLYVDPQHYDRLLRVLELRLGHALAAHAESAKIAVAAGGSTGIDLREVAGELKLDFAAQELVEASREDTARIVAAARDTVQKAGVAPDALDAVYFTGGSTGLGFLSDALAGAFPAAEPVHGDRLASVATGLGIHARRVFA